MVDTFLAVGGFHRWAGVERLPQLGGMREEGLAWDKEGCSHSCRDLCDSHPKGSVWMLSWLVLGLLEDRRTPVPQSSSRSHGTAVFGLVQDSGWLKYGDI